MRWVITINTYWAGWRPTLSQRGHLQKLNIFVGVSWRARVRAQGAAAPATPVKGVLCILTFLAGEDRRYSIHTMVRTCYCQFSLFIDWGIFIIWERLFMENLYSLRV